MRGRRSHKFPLLGLAFRFILFRVLQIWAMWLSPSGRQFLQCLGPLRRFALPLGHIVHLVRLRICITAPSPHSLLSRPTCVTERVLPYFRPFHISRSSRLPSVSSYCLCLPGC
ncbi:hypothetical protein B0H10DRAFT_258984 [Mycena sp. CBHHK59/15]|nr:hypothetical protein B0H10DRAFT_258984 [Mycena sp. CBHHK59/15]